MVTFFSHLTKGFTKLASILLGLATGYALAAAPGMVNFQAVYNAGWLETPKFAYFGVTFPPHAVTAMIIMFIVNSQFRRSATSPPRQSARWTVNPQIGSSPAKSWVTGWEVCWAR